MWVYCYSHSCFTYNSKTGRRTRESQNLGILSYNIYRSSSFYCTSFQRALIQRYDIAYTIFYSWLNCTGHAYVVENIIMFIPFGFLLPQLWAHMRNLGLCLLSAFITSMVIEVTQVVTKMGYGQTDDVITNVIGAAIGFGILWTVQKIKLTNRY